jgi:hypothetical protein
MYERQQPPPHITVRWVQVGAWDHSHKGRKCAVPQELSGSSKAQNLQDPAQRQSIRSQHNSNVNSSLAHSACWVHVLTATSMQGTCCLLTAADAPY